MAGYLRYLEAGTEAERTAHRSAFLRDVRARVKELAKRDYANESAKQSVDYVLLFLRITSYKVCYTKLLRG